MHEGRHSGRPPDHSRADKIYHPELRRNSARNPPDDKPVDVNEKSTPKVDPSIVRQPQARLTIATTTKMIARMTKRWMAPVTRWKTNQQMSQSTRRMIAIVHSILTYRAAERFAPSILFRGKTLRFPL